jgi:hypothetical protein
MTPMALNLNQRRYVETVLAGLPHLAEAVAAIPPDWQSEAFQAAERSYLKAFRQLQLSGPQTWTLRSCADCVAEFAKPRRRS